MPEIITDPAELHLHAAVIGRTKSGKTFLCQQKARTYHKAGVGVLVLHKPQEPWPVANWQTSDPEKFIAKFWKCWNCVAFIEISDADVDKFDDRFHKCFTQGRHQGHRCYYLAQRGMRAHPNIRENCDGLYLFSCYPAEAKGWAEQFGDDELLKAAKLPPRHFYFKPNAYTPARLLYLSK